MSMPKSTIAPRQLLRSVHIYLFIYLKSSKTHTSAAPLLLEKNEITRLKTIDR